MELRALGIAISCIATSLRIIADQLTMISQQMNPRGPLPDIWDREQHKLIPAMAWKNPEPITLVKGQTPVSHDVNKAAEDIFPSKGGPFRD